MAICLSNIYTARAGVLPFTIRNEYIYFLLAVDCGTQEYCDFGGGRKKYETSLSTSLREFKEETRNILPSHYYDQNYVSNCISIVDGTKNAITFIPLQEIHCTDIFQKFECTTLSHKSNMEISNMCWVSGTNLNNMVKHKDRVLWKKLRFVLENINTRELYEHLHTSYSLSYQ